MTAYLSGPALEALRARQPRAVAAAVEEHASSLLAAAFGLGLKPVQAEELVQATFVSFLEGLDRFEGRSTVRTYLFGILYRKALESWRKSAREQATDPVDAIFEGKFAAGHWISRPKGPEEEAVTRETARLLAECLEGLGPEQRAAFHLREVEAEDSESICNILGVSGTNLRVLLFRARNKLRDCLEKKWAGAEK